MERGKGGTGPTGEWKNGKGEETKREERVKKGRGRGGKVCLLLNGL